MGFGRVILLPLRVPSRTYATSSLSYVSVPGKVPLSPLTVGQLLDQVAEKTPDQVGVVFSKPTPYRRTFGQLKEDVSVVEVARVG